MTEEARARLVSDSSANFAYRLWAAMRRSYLKGVQPGVIAQATKPAEPIGSTGAQVLEHSFRTAVTAVVSMLVSELFRLPQSYWAPITTIVITQSSLGSTLAVSWQRFVGTALGAVIGAVVAARFGPHMLVFGVGVFLMGLCCAALRVDRSAYRFGGVTLGIVLLLPRTEPSWRVASHRFAEVSIGIAVALVMTVLWPERSSRSELEKRTLP
jgi:uncharacterized membrane protein YgaE (UPF0421/DUF939 family)